MKKILLALSLASCAGLAAKQSNKENKTMIRNECGCEITVTPCGETPNSFCCSSCGESSCCCQPAPQKCIDCECYTPQYYNLQCAWGLFASVDFLYWFAKETGLSYALEAETVESLSVAEAGVVMQGSPDVHAIVPRKYRWMDESWDPGFRLGVGFNDCCDGWDLYLNWTYFHTKEKRSVSIQPIVNDQDTFFPLGKSLFSPWITPSNTPTDALNATNPANFINWYSSISAKWRLNFNVIDLELGRNFWLSRCFSFRPYMGIRGGWTKTTFSTTPILNATFDTTLVNTANFIKFKNRFWGVGLLGGFQPNWHLGCGFSLFGNADLSLLWGCFDSKRSETINTRTTTGTLFVRPYGTSKSAFSAMQAILDLGIGVRWESTYCCDRYRLNLDLGWDHHIWFDHNHRPQLRGAFIVRRTAPPDIIGQSFQDYDETYGNLVLAGLVVRARFDF